MEYAAITFWLLIVVLTALGVHRLWSSMVQPKVVNSLLLPGTLVAQLGYVLGLLITGGTVNNTTLIKDDDSGEPETPPETKTRIPVLGTVIIALLPMVGCAAAIYCVSRYFGTGVLSGMDNASLKGVGLPGSFGLFFGMLRHLVSLVEQLVGVVRGQDLTQWQNVLFLYLAVCLTVRMSPLTGNLRGALGAIVITGVLTYLAGQVTNANAGLMATAWPLLTFSLAVLLFLLMLSLLLKGTICLIKSVSQQG